MAGERQECNINEKKAIMYQSQVGYNEPERQNKPYEKTAKQWQYFSFLRVRFGHSTWL